MHGAVGMTQLFERNHFLAALTTDLESAAAGTGRAVLVCGEAGIGKTTLLEHFVASHADKRCLWGACEALFTPHPLGPLHDIARMAGGRLKTLLEEGTSRAVLFAAVLDELIAPSSPVFMVIEDVHWADAATLDLIKFLGRRIHHVPALLILTYRDDEIDAVHPLRAVLGELPPRQVSRVALSRLTQPTVEAMASRAQRDGAGLYATTGGNPFFVTEVLSNRTGLVPATVRDAVLARAARLSPGAREVLGLAAIVPRAVEIRLIDAVLKATVPAIEECVAGGLLLADEKTLRFRHELARVAVEESLAAPTARDLHARVLATLSGPGSTWSGAAVPPLARLVHHAYHAGDGTAVLRLAPQAAHEAASRGARREAAAHCRAALAFSGQMSDAEHAALLEDYARHCFELNDLAAAIPAREEAISLFGKIGDFARQSASLAAHAMPLVRALRNADADAASQRAIALAERLPPGPELARAYETEAYLRMLNRDCREAVVWGQKSIALAEEFDDSETLAAAHNSVGAALLFIDYPRGCEEVLTSMRIAGGLSDGGAGVADAYMMLGSGSAEVFQFANAERYLTEGIAFARTHDLDRLCGYMEAWQASLDVYQGHWDDAGRRANALLVRDMFGSTNRLAALVALCRLRIRRGDPGVDEALDEALELATRSGTLQRLAPVRCLRAERAWLAGDIANVCREASAAFGLASQKQHAWFLGEMAYWRWRVGDLGVAPPGYAEPYALQIAGRWRAAATAWKALGCPYEQGRALIDGDSGAQHEALEIFERLGARPIADWLRAHMRKEGIRGVPRGPRQATRNNPAGLTAREMQVLLLVAEGCPNSQIADQLSRSLRTVDHHLAAILAKLAATSRTEAVAAARRLGIVPQK